MWRVAVLHHGSPSSLALAELREGLHRRGLIHGVNCVVDAAGVEGQWERLPMLVEQLLQRGPDVMVALISGVSRAGYVALRFAGQRYGFALLVLDWGKLSA